MELPVKVGTVMVMRGNVYEPGTEGISGKGLEEISKGEIAGKSKDSRRSGRLIDKWDPKQEPKVHGIVRRQPITTTLAGHKRSPLQTENQERYTTRRRIRQRYGGRGTLGSATIGIHSRI
jgi:hypothetical protein